MLDKIININTDVRLSANGKSSRYDRTGRRPINPQEQEKDSLIFSPAAAYLAELEWELHSLSYPEENKVSLEFVISGFLFKFIIDFSNYYSSLSQSIYISKKIEKKRISAIISLAKRKLWLIDHYQHIPLAAIEALFEKIASLPVSEKLEDSTEVEAELIRLEIKLNSELQYILAAVFTFLDKLGKFRIVEKFQFNNEAKELVKIEKVTVKDAK